MKKSFIKTYIIMEQKEEKKKVEEQQLDEVNGGEGQKPIYFSAPFIKKTVTVF